MNHDLSLIATQLLSNTMSYAESKGSVLPDEVKITLLNNEALKETFVNILAEAEGLQEDAIKKYEQLMEEMTPHVKEISEWHATRELTASHANKQLAVSTQLTLVFYNFLYTISMTMQPLLNETPEESSAGLIEYYKGSVLNIVNEMTHPEWKHGIFFPLKYPEVTRIINEAILAKSIAMMPEPYQSTVKAIRQKEGFAAASQKMASQMPALKNSDWIQKGGLLNLLSGSISRDAVLAALASNNLSVMSEAFSEEALDALLEAAMHASNSVVHIQRFTDGLSLRLKYPELYHAVKESVIRKMVSLVPEGYKNTLEVTLQEASLVVALQTLEVQIPALVSDDTLSEETAQKVLLVSVAVSVLSQQKELLALAHESLSVVSTALKEAFDSFVGSAVKALQEAHEDKVIDDQGQPNVHLQSCIEQFIASLKNRFSE